MVYTPPNGPIENHRDLTSYLTTIMALSNPVLILGDFNLPEINWSTLSGYSAALDNVGEFIFNSNLTQLVDTPTHTCGNILDLVLTNCPEQIFNLLVYPLQYQCVSSDHYLITFSVAFRYHTPSPSIREVINFKRGDYAGLSEYLLSCDFSTFYNLSDIDEMWYIL